MNNLREMLALALVLTLWFPPAVVRWGRWFAVSVGLFVLAEVFMYINLSLLFSDPNLDDSPALILAVPLFLIGPALLFVIGLVVRFIFALLVFEK